MMFGAAQCLGYRMEHGTGTKEMCYPSEETIIQDVAEVLDETGVKTVFVATDSKDLIKKMSKVFDKVSSEWYKLYLKKQTTKFMF